MDSKEKITVTAQSTLANAIRIGDPVSYDKATKAILETDGIVEQATEQELVAATAHADLTGMFTCPHTGVALAVLTKLLKRGVIKSSDKTVVISTAHALKFTDFKVAYHESKLEEVTSEYANPAVHLPADVDEVKPRLSDECTSVMRRAIAFICHAIAQQRNKDRVANRPISLKRQRHQANIYK